MYFHKELSALIAVGFTFMYGSCLINKFEDDKTLQYLKGIRFTTNLIEDINVSTFHENYVTISMHNNNVVPTTEISFCFRWQFYIMVGQCFFQESNLGILFKSPSISRVGYVVVHGAYVMFEIPTKIKFVPLVWHHICISYKDYAMLVVMDGIILLNKNIKHFEELKSTEINFKEDLMLGKFYLYNSNIL